MNGARKFGGMTLLHRAEGTEETLRHARERRTQQQEYKAEMDAAEAYKAGGGGGGGGGRGLGLGLGLGGGAFERRRRQRSATDLPSTSDKIGSAPVPFLNRKKNKWVAWKEEAVVQRREREAIWSSLGGGAKKEHAVGAHAKLNPITHEPLTVSPGRPRRGQNGGVGAPRESADHYRRHSGLVNRMHSQQGLQFVPRTTQVLKPFNVEDLSHGAFTKRNARQNITLPFSPLRRSTYRGSNQTQHETISPARYGGGIYTEIGGGAGGRNRRPIDGGGGGGGGSSGGIGGRIGRTDLYSNNARRTKAARRETGLVSMDDMRRRQFREALLVEKGRNGDNLYETDVRRICNLFFIPSNSVNMALRNAMSVLSKLGDNKVNLDVFMRRLFGAVVGQQDAARPGGGVPTHTVHSLTFNGYSNPAGGRAGRPFGIGYRGGQQASPTAARYARANPMHDYIDSFQDGPPQVPPHLESQRKLVLGRRQLQRRGGPRVTKSWFLPDEDLVKAPYPTNNSSPSSSPNLRKTSGTQTEIDGEYGSNRSIMESIVRNHQPFQALNSNSASPIGSELAALGSPVNFLRASGLATSEAMDVQGLDFAESSVLDPLDAFAAYDKAQPKTPKRHSLILMEGLEATVAADDQRIEGQQTSTHFEDGLLEQLMRGPSGN